MENNYLIKKMKIVSTIFIIAIAFCFQSCSNHWTTFEEGKFEGKKYVVQSRSSSGFFSSTNSVDYRLKLENLPYVPINALTTDWDVVYTTAIFGKDAFEYTTNQDIHYRNSTDSTSLARSFLYVSPKDFSKEEFYQYSLFLKSKEWQKVDSLHVDKAQERCPFPHIVGLVYGEPENYQKDFKGKYLDGMYILRIENDGRIRLIDDKNLGELGTGLSRTVQMPNMVIYIDKPSPGSFTIEDIKQFKNEKGQTALDFFKFLPKP
jgi:hypothetical protein